MEATWKTESFEYLKLILDTSLTGEETREAIVPDAYPDMAQVVDVEGNITLRSKEAGAGRISVSGSVAANVLYLPEGEGGLKSIELTLPFTMGYDASEITDEASLTVKAKLSSIDARMINSRKVLVRADILVEAKAYEPSALSLASELEDEAADGLHVRKEQVELSFVSQVREKTFVLADDFSLPAGKPAIGQILKSRIRLRPDDVKNVGNKLIFKGAAHVHLLYTGAQEAEPTVLDLEASFSQIMELEGEGEGANYEISLMLTNAYVENGTTESGGVTLELHLVAQAVERKTRQMHYISDAYSTRFDLDAGRTEYTLESQDEKETHTAEVRESIELPAGILRVVDTSAHTGRVQWGLEGGRVISRTSVSLSVVYVTEAGALEGQTRRFEAAMEMDARENENYAIEADVGADLAVTQTADGIEVRLPVSFTVWPTRKGRVFAIDSLSWDEEAPRDLEALPSVVVFHAEGGESLWHLAKRYTSTEAQIMAANSLIEDAVPYPGQLFIIPKAR